jgi:alkanesulfonate monooxygenase SsuD/methylene tetrahydromethanopterin reductase-like flavin-dependent oxidoreductase (luciferase family)
MQRTRPGDDRLGDRDRRLGRRHGHPERERLGKRPGEIILQAGFSWAEDDDAALEGARVWKGAQPREYYTDDWHDPTAMYPHAEEKVSDDEFRKAYIISSDPEEHAERVREIEKDGADSRLPTERLLGGSRSRAADVRRQGAAGAAQRARLGLGAPVALPTSV